MPEPDDEALVVESEMPEDAEAEVETEIQVQEKSETIIAPVQDTTVAKDEGWEDLDKEDEDDPVMVAEYVVEIFEYLKKLEVSPFAVPF